MYILGSRICNLSQTILKILFNKEKPLYLIYKTDNEHLQNIHAAAWKVTQRMIHLRVRRWMRKVTMGLLASAQFYKPIRITHGVHMSMIGKTK